VKTLHRQETTTAASAAFRMAREGIRSAWYYGAHRLVECAMSCRAVPGAVQSRPASRPACCMLHLAAWDMAWTCLNVDAWKMCRKISEKLKRLAGVILTLGSLNGGNTHYTHTTQRQRRLLTDDQLIAQLASAEFCKRYLTTSTCTQQSVVGPFNTQVEDAMTTRAPRAPRYERRRTATCDRAISKMEKG
jgi:hypothetical protein